MANLIVFISKNGGKFPKSHKIFMFFSHFLKKNSPSCVNSPPQKTLLWTVRYSVPRLVSLRESTEFVDFTHQTRFRPALQAPSGTSRI